MLVAGPPRDGIIRTSPGQECSKDKGALPGTRGILLYLHYYRWPGDNEVTQTVFSGKPSGPRFYDFRCVLAACGENRTQMSARGRKVQV